MMNLRRLNTSIHVEFVIDDLDAKFLVEGITLLMTNAAISSETTHNFLNNLRMSLELHLRKT